MDRLFTQQPSKGIYKLQGKIQIGNLLKNNNKQIEEKWGGIEITLKILVRQRLNEHLIELVE